MPKLYLGFVPEWSGGGGRAYERLVALQLRLLHVVLLQLAV
jgi:hypothetical protein